METNNNNTAAVASIDDITECEARADAQVRALLGRVLAQKRSVGVALDYVTALAPGTKANCWALAEAAGHEGWGRMQGLLRSYQWDWKELRAQLPALAAAWIPGEEEDLIGPGIAIDETAQLKHGDGTACVAPQHAGCTGKVENCVTTVFSAYVTARGQAWADFDVYMPDRWAGDLARRRDAGIPGDLVFATKPQLAMDQLERLLAAGLPARWAAFDEVYGRSEKLREQAAKAGLAYVAIIPCDYQVTLPSGAVIRADEAVRDAAFERRSCGNGSKGPRYSDWAMTATSIEGQSLLIRRLISRPEQLHFLSVLGAARPPGDHDLFHHHRRAPLAGGRNVQNGKRRTRLGPVSGPALRGHLPAHGTGRPRPAPRRRHPRRAGRQHHHARRAPPTTTSTAATAASATLSCRSPSATRPSRTAAAGPARPASRRSGCPSPRPSGSPSWPGSTPPG